MSLRARLIGLVLLATLLPALLLGWRFYRETDTEIAGAVRSLATAADNVAAGLMNRVQGTAQLHYGLAHSRMLDSDDRTACSAYLSDVREAYPQYTGILTVRPNGRLHCDSLQLNRVLDLSDRAYVQRIQAGATDLVLEPVFGRLTGTGVLQIVYPARASDGALRFMLVASLNLQKFAAEVQRQSLPAPPQLLLVSRQGTVMASAGGGAGLARPGTSIADSAVFKLAQARGAGGTGELIGLDGEPQVWAVAASPVLQAAGLQVLLGLPRQALVAESTQRLRQGLWVLAGAALLLFAGVWLLAEWGIRRQVGRITALARDLGAGNLKARIAPPHPRGELGGLMAVFNSTADSLELQREAIAQLDQRLREAHRREITEREQNEAHLFKMANFDGLTGLPNRVLFLDRLEQALARTHRSAMPFALMFLDIDRFKHVNDSLGHDVGDRLLVAVAEVLAGCLRDTDLLGRLGGEGRDSHGVFRIGGDEFTVLAEGLVDAAAATAIAQRLLQALKQPFMVGEHELFVSASIGITVHAAEGADPETLIKQADMAMYRAKEQGRDTFCFFDEALNREASRRHQLETQLRHALERNEFALHYQPKAELVSGRVTGVEALLRWQPTGQALVGPDQFIPVLEETGLIVAVGAWVLRQACSQMMAWRREGMPPIHLAVNLSARQFRHQELVSQIAAVLADTGLDPGHLEIELTESMLIDDSQAVLGIMAGLGAMGVGVAIDDFGTGHSSLSYLHRFQVDTLKIDRSFVKDTPADAERSAIAVAVIALGHGLRLKVVAEGVETTAQRDFLRAQGCDEFQGYLLSRPLDASAFVAWMAVHQAGQGQAGQPEAVAG
ncbi:MAG: EAL domain-containing protein [Burkholderiales bacterium]